MKKYILLIILYCQYITPYGYAESRELTLINSTANIEADLKTIGRTLANYRQCELLAKQFNDPVMVYYYADIYTITVNENEGLSESEWAIVDTEKEKASSLLDSLNSVGLNKLCLERFDSVSRQHYQTKLEKID